MHVNKPLDSVLGISDVNALEANPRSRGQRAALVQKRCMIWYEWCHVQTESHCGIYAEIDNVKHRCLPQNSNGPFIKLLHIINSE
jgi:hypothetical protein